VLRSFPSSSLVGKDELLSIELLEEHARRLAALISIAPKRNVSGHAHLRQTREHMRALRTIYAALADDARQEPMSPAAEWLLDNFHIISSAARDIHNDLPASFFKRLPFVAADEFAGLPRIYALALELIGSSAGRLDAQRLKRFISAFQSITPLTMGELWAWPSALKLALLDHLHLRGEVLSDMRAHRLAADRLVSTIESTPTGPDPWPAHVHHAFVVRLLQRSRALGAMASRLHHQLELALEARGESLEDSIRAEGQHQASEQAGMANLIGSLRLISTFDWSEFFESVSLVEQVLQRDPAGVYSQMDFLSRDRYRHAIEELAVTTGEGQLRIALKSVERARQAHHQAPDTRPSHVGYHLIGGGRRQFERSVAWQPSRRQWTRRMVFECATPGYHRRHHDRHRRARGRRHPLRAGVRVERHRPVAGRVDHRHTSERAGDPASPAADQLSAAAPRTSASRTGGGAGVGQDDGHRTDHARQRRARQRPHRASRGAGARECRCPYPLRLAERFF
jgi:cyclic beta-1,2-glucan synthetase